MLQVHRQLGYLLQRMADKYADHVDHLAAATRSLEIRL
jgi:hypothetical protein